MNLDYIITEPPKVFGLFHIACILIVIVICVILGVKYKNPTEQGLNRTLLIFGLIMLVLEILLVCKIQRSKKHWCTG